LDDAYVRSRLGWELVPLAVAAAIVAAAPRLPRRASAAACLTILVVCRMAEAGRVYPSMPASAFYPPVPVLDRIPRGTPDRIVALGPLLIPNAATMYGLEDVRGYESMTLRRL